MQHSHSSNTPPANAKSHQLFTDSEITTKVKTLYVDKKLFSNDTISAMTVHVETINGVVYLSGTADSKTQIRNAISLARSVSGVTEVKSTVVVQ